MGDSYSSGLIFRNASESTLKLKAVDDKYYVSMINAVTFKEEFGSLYPILNSKIDENDNPIIFFAEM